MCERFADNFSTDEITHDMFEGYYAPLPGYVDLHAGRAEFGDEFALLSDGRRVILLKVAG